jgi:hypothetical protein
VPGVQWRIIEVANKHLYSNNGSPKTPAGKQQTGFLKVAYIAGKPVYLGVVGDQVIMISETTWQDMQRTKSAHGSKFKVMITKVGM